MTEESLTSRTSTSILWMTGMKWVTRIGALVGMVVLTRTLTPEDFGLAAAATTLMPLMYVLADVGFSTYIIQAEKTERRTLNTAFWFSLASGLLLAGGVAVAAPLIALVLKQPAVEHLVQGMAVSVLLIATASVPTALMRRRMAFRSLALSEILGSLLAQVAAIVSALMGAGAWALVLQVLVSQVVGTIWVWIAARWRPTSGFSVREFVVMGKFGLHVMGSDVVMVARAWAETAIVVSGLGVREMGMLNIAQRLIQAAQDLSVSALMPVSMVAFSQVRDDPARLRSSYLKASSIAHAVITPLMVYVAVSAPVLIPFLFGPGKIDSAMVAPAVAAWALLNTGWAIDQGLYIGVGRPGRWFALIATAYCISVAILASSVQFGLMTLVTIWAGTAALEAVIRWLSVWSLIGIPPWRAALPLLGVLGPSAVAAGVGWGTLRLLAGTPDFLQLVCSGIVLVAGYLVALRFLRRQTFVDTISVLPQRISRLVRWTLPKERPTLNESA